MKKYKRNNRETAYQILIDNLLDAREKNLEVKSTDHERQSKRELLTGLLKYARTIDEKTKSDRKITNSHRKTFDKPISEEKINGFDRSLKENSESRERKDADSYS